MDSNVRAKFKAELQDIYPQLLARAELLVQRSGWRRRFDMNRKSVAEDLLHEAVVRIWSGTRRPWEPAKGTLLAYLTWQMKNLVFNFSQSPENKTSSLDEPAGDGPESKGDLTAHEAPDVETLHIRKETAEEMEAALFEAAGDDPVLLKYVEAMMDGVGTQAGIAERTGLPIEEVYQAHRKLARRIKARRKKESAA